LGAFEDEDEQDDNLVDGMAEDVAPHNSVNNAIIALVGETFEQGFAGRLSREGKRCQGVHDQVDPEHLDGGHDFV